MMQTEANFLNGISEKIIGAAMQVHRRLGPGLLESVYEKCLAYELDRRGLSVRRQVPVPVTYDDLTFAEALRLDLLVEDAVVVELKATENTLPVHKRQPSSYLVLCDKRLGLLINFGCEAVRQGLTRVVHRFPDATLDPSCSPSDPTLLRRRSCDWCHLRDLCLLCVSA